jgi:hypothetical protein
VNTEDAAWRSRRYVGLAKTYEQAARAIADAPGFESLHPPFFALLGQAAELALKAVIARGGYDDERLLMLGHDLTRCWDLAQAHITLGDAPAEQIGGVIDLLAAPHQAQAFRYPTLLTWPLPLPGEALRAVGALLVMGADGAPRAAANGD